MPKAGRSRQARKVGQPKRRTQMYRANLVTRGLETPVGNEEEQSRLSRQNCLGGRGVEEEYSQKKSPFTKQRKKDQNVEATLRNQ